MKRLILIVTLIALLLAGCGGDIQDTTGDTTLPPETTVPETTLDSGLYDPDSVLERASGGAVRVYPLDGLHEGMLFMGEDILLFEAYLTGDTTVRLLTGENCRVKAEADLSGFVNANESGVGISVGENSLTYYDQQGNALVTLNDRLWEVGRVQLPEELVTIPLIGKGGTTAYYTVDGQLRVLDTQTGISRLLREQEGDTLIPSGLHCEGTVLEITVRNEGEKDQTLYLSAENGELVHEGEAQSLLTREDRFYAGVVQFGQMEHAFGQIGGDTQSLMPVSDESWFAWLPERHAALSAYPNDDALVLDYYHLTEGRRTASVSLPDTTYLLAEAADPENGYVWLLCWDADSGDVLLLRWDPSLSPVEDETVYTGRYQTAKNPDLEGIENCRREAQRLTNKYGVRFLLWEDALELGDEECTLEAEYRVRQMSEALEILDKAMARFPAGFFKTAAEQSDYGAIHIGLVARILDAPEGGGSSVTGLQLWKESDPYILLVMSDSLEQDFYHEIFHVIENRIFGKTSYMDNWDTLNPSGFDYDYDYTTYRDRTDDTYLTGEDRAFVDYYAMTFPREDRARLMEYAMQDGMEEVFESSWMQTKLLRICRGIRESFDLEDYGKMLPWEQYLEKDLVP